MSDTPPQMGEYRSGPMSPLMQAYIGEQAGTYTTAPAPEIRHRYLLTDLLPEEQAAALREYLDLNP